MQLYMAMVAIETGFINDRVQTRYTLVCSITPDQRILSDFQSVRTRSQSPMSSCYRGSELPDNYLGSYRK